MKKGRWMLGMALGCLGLILVLGPALAAEKPIKIGVVFIMSGPMGGYGKHGRQAVQLALDEYSTPREGCWAGKWRPSSRMT